MVSTAARDFMELGCEVLTRLARDPTKNPKEDELEIDPESLMWRRLMSRPDKKASSREAFQSVFTVGKQPGEA